jgi:sensor c-di-GMP phosphodiesterase-like protein
MKINNALNYSVLLFLMVFFSGLSVIEWTMEKFIDKASYAALKKTTNMIDKVLSHADQAASNVLAYKYSSCDEHTLAAIRKIVADIPYVRSINLIKDGEAYCSSIFGEKSSFYNEAYYQHYPLMILNNNSLTLERSAIIYRSVDEHGDGSLVSIDGYYLYSILNLLSSDFDIGLVVGDRYMNSDGVVSQPPQDTDTIRFFSLKFSYSVVATSSTARNFIYLVRVNAGAIIVMVLLSLLTASSFYRYTSYRNTLDYRLNKAMTKGLIFPVIQPVICVNTGRITGGEVLLRWVTSDGKDIPPDLFIPSAEKSGKIKALTTLAIEKVTADFKSSGRVIPSGLSLFFNVSSANFEDDTLLNDCLRASSIFKLFNIHIGLEITERTLIEESERSRHITDSLRKYDIKFALDDFGTGNANYTYIRQFHPQFLKIDKAFTRNVTSDYVSHGFIKNMISLARLAGCNTIAEGVEDQAQATVLRALGVDYFQGFFYSKPVPVKQFFDEVYRQAG